MKNKPKEGKIKEFKVRTYGFNLELIDNETKENFDCGR